MFTRISWLILLSSGLILFASSLYIEAIVLDAFLPSALAAFAVATALESAKAVTIVLNRYVRVASPELGKRRSRFFNAGFRLGLVLFSALCSLMFLSAQINSPRLEQVRQADIEKLEQHYQQQRTELQQHGIALSRDLQSRLNNQNKTEIGLLDRRHLGQIEKLENDLSSEMDNAVGGEFEGPRYRAIERRLNAAKTDFATARQALLARQTLRTQEQIEASGAQHTERLDSLAVEFHQNLKQLRLHDYAEDNRVEHPLVHNMLDVAAAVLPVQPTTMQFTWVFALGLSLLIELGIMVTFDTLMLAWLPVFSAVHQADVATQSRKVANDQKLREETLDDSHFRDRVRAKRRHAEQSLDDALSDLAVDTPSA